MYFDRCRCCRRFPIHIILMWIVLIKCLMVSAHPTQRLIVFVFHWNLLRARTVIRYDLIFFTDLNTIIIWFEIHVNIKTMK